MAKEIPLTNSDKVAIVDDEVYEYLMQWKWAVTYNGYAVRNTKKGMPRGKSKAVLMHREILCLGTFSEDPVFVDHVNGNKLDNRLDNLRLVDKSQNAANRGIDANNTSGYKGVSWHKQRQKWRAYIVVNDRQKHLGLFDSKHDAARAYNEAALYYFGEYAKLNEIRESEEDA